MLRLFPLCAPLLALPSFAVSTALPPRYDGALPPVVRVCIQSYPPFVMQRNWVSPSLSALAHPPGFHESAGLSGVVFTGANVSMLDGFDVTFVQLVATIAGVQSLTFLPYPDTSSLYVGLRNGDCHFAASAIELDVSRATCGPSCPDTSTHRLPELPASDYGTAEYLDRLQGTCCLEYGVSYLTSGFALLSLSQTSAKPPTVVASILSVDMMNAASPVIIALLGFATLIWLFERQAGSGHFRTPFAALYYAFVCTATFGFGDLTPTTRPGRLLTMFWAVFVVLTLGVLGAILSSNLTLNALIQHPIDTLAQVGDPRLVCVEATYELANRFVADAFNLALNKNVQAQGVMLGSVETCTQAVLDGTVRVYLTDRPLLNWIAYVKLTRGDLYVSGSLRNNPLVWAYPSNSPLRPLLDAAIISALVNGSWVPQVDALQRYWFPSGSPSTTLATPALDAGTFGWAVALTVLWAVFAVTAEACPGRVSRMYRGLVGARGDGASPSRHSDDRSPAGAELAMQSPEGGGAKARYGLLEDET